MSQELREQSYPNLTETGNESPMKRSNQSTEKVQSTTADMTTYRLAIVSTYLTAEV
jgi:hypothetical protein